MATHSMWIRGSLSWVDKLLFPCTMVGSSDTYSPVALVQVLLLFIIVLTLLGVMGLDVMLFADKQWGLWMMFLGHVSVCWYCQINRGMFILMFNTDLLKSCYNCYSPSLVHFRQACQLLFSIIGNEANVDYSLFCHFRSSQRKCL